MKTPFAQKVIQILRDYCDTQCDGNAREASRSLGLDPDTGYYARWINSGKPGAKTSRVPRIDSVGPLLDQIGAVLLGPGETLDEGSEAARLKKELSEAQRRIFELQNSMEALRQENAALIGYKFKWEGHLESMAVQSSGTLSVSELHAYQTNSSEKESARKSTTASLGSTKAG